MAVWRQFTASFSMSVKDVNVCTGCLLCRSRWGKRRKGTPPPPLMKILNRSGSDNAPLGLVASCPRELTFTWWGSYGLCLWHKPTELAHSFLFCSCFYFCLYGPFSCISLHKFSRQLSVFSVCSSGLISALLVLSTVCLLMKVSFSPDIIPSGWLGSKHQLTH